MANIPIGTELVRPFMPAKDSMFPSASTKHWDFEKVLDGEVAIFRAGSGGSSCSVTSKKTGPVTSRCSPMVDDLDAWWAHIESLDLTQTASQRHERLRSNPGDFAQLSLWIRLVSYGTLRNDAKMQSQINDGKEPNKLLHATCEDARA